jgi:hypothetical protein
VDKEKIFVKYHVLIAVFGGVMAAKYKRTAWENRLRQRVFVAAAGAQSIINRLFLMIFYTIRRISTNIIRICVVTGSSAAYDVITFSFYLRIRWVANVAIYQYRTNLARAYKEGRGRLR